MTAFLHIRTLEKNSSKTYDVLKSSVTASVDSDILSIKIEEQDADIVSRINLQKRGSWRLAQDRFITNSQFHILKSSEFSKKL